MPTIRITDKTWKELNRVAKEFLEYRRIGFEDVLRISPDDTVKKLIDDWDMTDKRELMRVEDQARSGELDIKHEAYLEEIRKKKEAGTYIDVGKLLDDAEEEIMKQKEAGKPFDQRKILDDLYKEREAEAKEIGKKIRARKGKESGESEK